jgi:hypothetical protein
MTSRERIEGSLGRQSSPAIIGKRMLVPAICWINMKFDLLGRIYSC